LSKILPSKYYCGYNLQLSDTAKIVCTYMTALHLPTPLQIGIAATVGVVGFVWLSLPKVRKFDPRETVNLSEKVVLITGGSAGIGKVNVRKFAELGAKVYVIARNKEKTEAIIEKIKTETKNNDLFFIYGDLDKLETITDAAKEFLSKESNLHILVCNAGSGTRNRQWTSNGFELLFGQAPGSVRIVNVSSIASQNEAESTDFLSLVQTNTEPTANQIDSRPGGSLDFPAYSRSKLFQVLSTIKLSQILKGTGVSVYVLHPGVVASDIYNPVLKRGGFTAAAFTVLKKLTFITEEQGSLTTLYCSVSKDVAEQSGLYYDNCAVAKTKTKL
ncbi:Retinol dehydrogenase 12, partial [Physocladia obscura]